MTTLLRRMRFIFSWSEMPSGNFGFWTALFLAIGPILPISSFCSFATASNAFAWCGFIFGASSPFSMKSWRCSMPSIRTLCSSFARSSSCVLMSASMFSFFFFSAAATSSLSSGSFKIQASIASLRSVPRLVSSVWASRVCHASLTLTMISSNSGSRASTLAVIRQRTRLRAGSSRTLA